MIEVTNLKLNTVPTFDDEMFLESVTKIKFAKQKDKIRSTLLRIRYLAKTIKIDANCDRSDRKKLKQHIKNMFCFYLNLLKEYKCIEWYRLYNIKIDLNYVTVLIIVSIDDREYEIKLDIEYYSTNYGFK